MKFRIRKFYNSSRGSYNYCLEKKIFGLFWWDVHLGYDGYTESYAKNWAKHYGIQLPT